MYREMLENFEKIASEVSMEELEVFAEEVLTDMEKEAEEKQKKHIIYRNNQELLDNGGEPVSKVLKRSLGYAGVGAGVGAGAGALVGKGPGALVGAGIGANVGAIANLIKTSKGDKETLDRVIRKRLGENATEEDIKKAMKRYNWSTALPTSPIQ